MDRKTLTLKLISAVKFLINGYLITFILSIIILVWVLQLWQADLAIPFSGDIDALFNLITIKTIADTGGYFYNKFLGAPFSLVSHDLPMADSFHLIVLKLILLFADSATTLNLFFISTFPLTAITSFFVLKRLKISNFVSIVFSLLYTFLPYHFFRGLQHIFLGAYYIVPLVVLLTLSLWSNTPPLISKDQNCKRKLRFDLLSLKSIFCIFICIALGSSGVYYAFFGCFFIVIASISAFLSKRKKRIFLSAIMLIALISSSVFLNVLPSIAYNYKYGANEDVAQRLPGESEIFGLKIIHLLLPLEDHRFTPLKKLTIKYVNTNPPLQNENVGASLGIIGSLGFLSLLFRVIFLSLKTGIKKSSSYLYDRLAVLNIAAVLFATIGGFSSIFAVIVSPQLRGGNRISIFIAFFSLLYVAIFIDLLQKKYVNNKKRKIIFNFILSIILILGILDQTSLSFIPNYSSETKNYLNDKKFVTTIERLLPNDSMIFQLPYVPFPENPPLNNMLDYDLFRGYLHSKNLRWSYGSMLGRNDNWHQLISEETLDNLLKKISIVGFNGIYIDRYGYSDYGKQLEKELQQKLGTKPIVSENERLAFFNMQLFNEDIHSRYTPKQIEAYKAVALHPIKLKWKDGFYALEQNKKEGKWRWSNKQSTLILSNPTSKTKKIQVMMALATVWPEKSNLKIESDLFSEVFTINSKQVMFSKEIIVPPGRHIIKFSSDAKQVNTPPQDLRKLFFRIYNFSLKEGLLEDYKILPLNQIELEWKNGFHNPEKILGEKWRWSDKQSTLIINNPISRNKKTRLSMVLATGWSNYSNLRIESDLFSEVVKINSKRSVFAKEILLPPGKHTIKFFSEAKQVNAPGDSRKLFFRINDILY